MDDADNPFSQYFGLRNSSNSGNFTSENSYPQTDYHPDYYYPNTTMPNLQDTMSSYYPQPPFSSESNMVHDFTRREGVEASSMHQESSLQRSQMESDTPQSDNIQEVNAQANNNTTSSSNPNTSEIDNVDIGDKRLMGQKAAKAVARNKSKVKKQNSSS
uniref:Uncharacterized protein n=1 Tax=Chenopodium quinoa TaxID=63459 RepID=A0A803LUV7_CHEQI